MGDDALTPPPAPKRRGCLRPACGCAAVIAVLSLALVAGGWFVLSGWTPAGGAWRRLPPGTRRALEVNGAAALLEAASRDPGALSLAGALLRPYRAILLSRGVPADQPLAETFSNLAGGLSWAYTLFFPNYALFGARGESAEDSFAILQPPRWFLWTAGAIAPEGRVDEIADDEGTRIFISFKDGFAVLALNPEMVERVLASWEENAAPFGRRKEPATDAERSAPYAFFASGGSEAAADAKTASAGTPAPFLSGGLSSHFAARSAPAGGAADGMSAKPPRGLRVLVVPAEDGWNVRLELSSGNAPADEFLAGPAVLAAETIAAPGAPSSVRLPDSSDAELALRLRPESVAALAETIAEKIPAALGGDFLRHGILDRADGRFTLLASRPPQPRSPEENGAAAPAAPLYPPLPSLAFGWSLGSSLAPAPFANFLSALADTALRAAASVLPVPLPPSLLRAEKSADGLSGTLSVPPVFTNGSRPAWKFLLDAHPMTGWLATYPSALPDAGVTPRLAMNALPAPEAGRVSAAANWDMSRGFIESAAALAADRLPQIPPESLPAPAGEIRFVLRFAEWFLTAYPRGTLSADIHAENHEARIRALIPFGMNVSLE